MRAARGGITCSPSRTVGGPGLASVFVSYSHKDESYREQLDAHLSTLKNQGLIDAWHDRRINPGEEFDATINSELDRADIILLLVSPDFLASPYIRDVELARAMARHKAGEARVIPVILRHCDWRGTPFGALLATPKDGLPIKAWPDIDMAFLDVVTTIRRALPTVEHRPRAIGAPKTALAFKISSPNEAQVVFPLPPGKTIRIGRHASNDLVLANDQFVSRLHCLATARGDTVFIEDTAPTNPLKINGVECQNGQMRVRDKLELGGTLLVLIPYA